MAFLNLNSITEKELLPGFHVRFVHTDSMTLAYWTIEEGAELPEHSHHHEQVLASVMEGEFELTVDGDVQIVRPGDVVVIPSNVVHSGRALTPCKMLDVFHPVREEYR